MRKKLLLSLTLIAFFGFSAVAQNNGKPDIIITKTSQKIEAKILEIGIDDVKYKKFNYQDGPTYTVKKCEIASINYKNGEVEVFPCDKPAQSSSQSYDYQTGTSSGSTAQTQKLPDNLPLASYVGYPISKTGYDYTFEGTNKTIDREALINFLEHYCPDAYNTYRSGRRQYTAGVVLGSLGGAMVITGSILVSVGYSTTYSYSYYYDYYRYSVYDEGMGIAGAVLMGVGGAMELGLCMPLCIAGERRMNSKTLDKYNSQCVRKNKPTASLNLGFQKTGGLGIGFNLNF
ncbi:MAG: hypothetical protein LBN95_09125 [Prevotellaceae bacterium]|jgi:hypothetical protein|nr:hypothetical protein [Prevotellaceae bacterium]